MCLFSRVTHVQIVMGATLRLDRLNFPLATLIAAVNAASGTHLVTQWLQGLCAQLLCGNVVGPVLGGVVVVPALSSEVAAVFPLATPMRNDAATRHGVVLTERSENVDALFHKLHAVTTLLDTSETTGVRGPFSCVLVQLSAANVGSLSSVLNAIKDTGLVTPRATYMVYK